MFVRNAVCNPVKPVVTWCSNTLDTSKSVNCHNVRLNKPVHSCNVRTIKPICSRNIRPTKPANYSKPVCTSNVNHSKPVCTSNVNHSKPVCTSNVNYSKLVCTSNVNYSKPVCTSNVNHSKSVCTSDVVRSKPACTRNVCKSKQAVQNVNSNKVVFPVDVGKSHCENNSMILPAECCICCLKFLLLLFLLPIFLVSMMSSTFHVSILNLNIIMNVHMTFLISTKLFKCKYIFETLFKTLSKVFYRHLYIYLITINFLKFCLLFDIAHSIKPNLFFVVVVILIPTKMLTGSKFHKHIKNCLCNINFIVLHMLQKILCFTQLTLQKLIDVLSLIDYFLYIADRVFKFLITGIFIICKHFFILLIIIFVIKLAFFNIFFINNVPLIVNQAKTINGTLPTTMAEDSLSYRKEEYISFSVTSENTKYLDYILRNYFILTLISQNFFCNFCNFSLFLQNPEQSY